MADLFGEVEQDVRAEQARAVAKRYGWVFSLVVLAAVIGVGIWQFLNWQQEKTDARLSAAYFTALRSLDGPGLADHSAAGIALFRPLAGADIAGIRSLARLRLAQLQADTGHLPDAIATLDKLAGDPQAPRPLRDLATLTSVQRQLSTGNLPALALRLQGIEGSDAPFRALALETSAMIDLAGGKTEQSRHLLQLLLADENATDLIRERANTLLQAIPAAAG